MERAGKRNRGVTIKRQSWKWLVWCALAVAALLLFFHLRSAASSFDWALAGRSFVHVDWRWLLVSLVPIGASYYGRALRWTVFLRPLKSKPNIGNVFSATVIGFSAIALFGRPGEFVRPYLIAVKERVPVPSQISAWALERIFDFLIALLVFAFSLTQLATAHIHSGSKMVVVLEFGGRLVAAGAVGVLVLILCLRHFSDPFHRKLLSWLRAVLPDSQLPKAEKLLLSCVQGVESTRSDSALLSILGYSIIEWALIALCYWCLAQSFSGVIHLTLVDVIVFMGFVTFGAAVQLPGIGGGMQVAAVVVLTEMFGVRLELAAAFAMFLWLLSFVAVVPFGLGLALKEGLDWRGLRRLGRETAL